jgi:hypothetical protein
VSLRGVTTTNFYSLWHLTPAQPINGHESVLVIGGDDCGAVYKMVKVSLKHGNRKVTVLKNSVETDLKFDIVTRVTPDDA